MNELILEKLEVGRLDKNLTHRPTVPAALSAGGTGGTLVGSGAVCTANAVNDAMSTGSGLFRLYFDNVTSGSEAITVYRIA